MDGVHAEETRGLEVGTEVVEKSDLVRHHVGASRQRLPDPLQRVGVDAGLRLAAPREAALDDEVEPLLQSQQLLSGDAASPVVGQRHRPHSSHHPHLPQQRIHASIDLSSEARLLQRFKKSPSAEGSATIAVPQPVLSEALVKVLCGDLPPLQRRPRPLLARTPDNSGDALRRQPVRPLHLLHHRERRGEHHSSQIKNHHSNHLLLLPPPIKKKGRFGNSCCDLPWNSLLNKSKNSLREKNPLILMSS